VLEDFPQKAFYTIGEVSRITGVRAHVLRYWEGQGKLLKPGRRRSRHRLYRPGDIQLIFEIKRLRDEEKLTLAAMRRQLQPRPPGPGLPYSPHQELLALLHEVREELQALRALLD
jgi:DNA-binding transcriptional MerR regulator